jgi:aarF domain-containing kinase
LESNGPAFIKLGQFVASRPDVFPKPLCDRLAELLHHAPAHSWELTAGALRHSGVAEYVESVERVPICSGSVAQVHRGLLVRAVDGVAPGTAVAIKVLHPGVQEALGVDLLLLLMVVNAVSVLLPSAARRFDLRRATAEFADLLLSQLDLNAECDNLLRFRFNFEGRGDVVFPAPLPTISTRDVLVETFEEGARVSDIPHGATSLRPLARTGAQMFLQMIFDDNFVHSDLHAGNLLYRSDPATGLPQLVVLDPGMVTVLSERERRNFIDLFAAITCGDGALAADLMIDRAPSHDHSPPVNRELFRQRMQHVLDTVGPHRPGFRAESLQLREVLLQLLHAVQESGVTIDGSFVSLMMSVVVSEGIVKRHFPETSIFAEAVPFLVEHLRGGELQYLVRKLREAHGPAILASNARLPIDYADSFVEAVLRRASSGVVGLLCPTAAETTGREDDRGGLSARG